MTRAAIIYSISPTSSDDLCLLFFKSKTELPDVASEDDLELLVVEAVDDGVDAGVEVANPQDVQVQAVGRLDFLQNDLLV